MEAMARELWTDERLDELNVRVDRGFEAMQREFTAIRTEMRTEFASVRDEMGQMRGEMTTEFASVRDEMGQMRGEMTTEFASVRREIDSVRGTIDSLRSDLGGQIAATQRMILQLFIPLIVTLVFGFAGMILALVVQP